MTPAIIAGAESTVTGCIPRGQRLTASHKQQACVHVMVKGQGEDGTTLLLRVVVMLAAPSVVSYSSNGLLSIVV